MNDHSKNNNRVTLRVWGDFACFTRPEMKVERVSYPIITPSAARGILEAIYWEPQMYYLIDSIHIIKRGRWFSVRRNEVTAIISIDNAKTWMRQPEKVSPIQAGGGAEDGTQRNMLALEDVEYLITAEVRLTKLAQQPRDNLAKYICEITRRAKSGKCFHRPCLGVREFDANFALEKDGADAAFSRRQQELAATNTPLTPIPYEPLGLMLYDVFDYNAREQGFRWMQQSEIEANEKQFETSLAGLKKGEQSKLRKDHAANVPRHAGAKITPRPAFFQVEIKDNVVRCHPDDANIKILTQTLEG